MKVVLDTDNLSCRKIIVKYQDKYYRILFYYDSNNIHWSKMFYEMVRGVTIWYPVEKLDKEQVPNEVLNFGKGIVVKKLI